ncbi:hypothetical protein QVD17_03243 [Tagetes erecta]|uniref:NB-ARC domain-containing protein n=1 Tax=Tagetes erecta TaxID=13708 RepID=A0AAD8L9N7_TARER|nr:hypothetical protein QVD17_03243 [Tagetes erecta]
MVVSGYETIFIPNIVKKVHCELGLKLYTIPTGLVGVETRAADITSWLRSEQHDHPVVAICGMGGSGKTTLAKHIYYSNKQNFDRSSLLEDIENQHDGMLGVQKRLLGDISGNMAISNVDEGALQLEKVIEMNKVLIVVDDIDDKDQLSTLFGTKVFSTQSKIVITTRLLKIDTWVGSISFGCHVHEIELLKDHESLGLLSYHAFGSQIPLEGFEELAVQLAQYCEGNPLALKVLGSSLSEGEGARIETWRSTLKSLNSLKGDLDRKIQGVLQKSFDTLPYESHKELFLHIGCLFLGEYVYDVERILEDDYHAESGMVALTNRCLLTFSTDGLKLAMHKLLQDMARKIVRNESKDPAKHSRVWCHDECYSLLKKGNGSETIEGLVLNMRRAEQGIQSMAFETSSLVNMKNLKYLCVDYVRLTGSYKNFPELRWLRWRGLNMKTVPPSLLMSSLVAIDMSEGELENFEPPMALNSLKTLDLSYSYKLVSIRNLHKLPKLEILNLYNCTSLTYICKTIGDLENLCLFDLGGCTELWTASINHKLVNQLGRLKALFICRGVSEQPLFSLPQSLPVLCLPSNEFKMLPSYIDLNLIWVLNLSCCPNLKSLPCLPSTLKELYVDWCALLENIRFQSTRFTLDVFTYDGCFKLYEIEGLFKLVPITALDEVGMGHMQWIKAYQDCKVDLVGDVITKGRTFNIQMLYEYGIRSTYLQGINDESIMKYEYMTSSGFLSFRVPLHPKNHRVQGLNVMFLYRSSGVSKDMLFPFSKISNTTKGFTWVYNPVVYCKPRVDNDVVWLSYWPIKNVFDTGDDVHVSIYVDTQVIKVRECGVSLVYMDDVKEEKEEKRERMEEVIGGDLSLLEVTKGGYYLCRRNFYNSMIPAWFFGHNIQITDSRRWRIYSNRPLYEAGLNNFRNQYHEKFEVTLGVSFDSGTETNKIKKAVSSVEGVESVSIHKETRRLVVIGCFDFQAVLSCVREFENMVQVLNIIRV